VAVPEFGGSGGSFGAISNPKCHRLGDDPSCNYGVRSGRARVLSCDRAHASFLVADIGRHWERLLAEGVSAVVVAGLTAGFMDAANQGQEAALLRMQVISEMNHHIRNALGAISLTTDSIQNHECVRVISDSVDRIEWTLREVLLRRKPISEKEIDRLRYTATKNPHPTIYTGQEKTNE